MNDDKRELSVILPVFNEGLCIEKTIMDVHGRAGTFSNAFEIVAVNDGSQDSSSKVLERLRQRLPELKIVCHEANEGYGAALRSGIRAAQGEWVLFMDSDGQYRFDSLGDAWPLRQGYDCLVGYREKRNDPVHRVVLGKLGNGISAMLLGMKVRDINCGFKLFRRSLLASLPLIATGNSIYFEMLYRLLKKSPRVRVFQFPVMHLPRTQGKPTGGDLKVLWKIAVQGVRILAEAR